MTANDQAADQLLESGQLLQALLAALTAEHPRDWQLAPGHSSVGGCRRAAAYGHHGTAPDPEWTPKASIAAWVGTAFHRMALPQLAKLLRPARIELETTWQPVLPLGMRGGFDTVHKLPPLVGHVDLYRRRSRLVLDVKTCSRHGLDRARREGPKPRHLAQVHANAASLAAEGKPCDRVALLYVCTETSLDRQDTGGLLWADQLDPAVTAAAVDWWRQVVDAGDPDDLPQDEQGPGLSFACDECPWLRQCWGPWAVPGQVGAQSVDPEHAADVVAALALLADADDAYTEAGRLQRAAKADRDFATAMLAGVDSGKYAHGGQVWELRWQRGQLRLDQARATGMLLALGLEPPKVRGRSAPKVVRP